MPAWSSVTVLRKSCEFSTLCPDCLRSGSFTAVPIPTDPRVKVPFCESCATRLLQRRKLARPLLMIAVVLAFGLMLWFDLSKWVGCWLAIVLVLPTVWLTDYRGQVVRVKRHDADRVTLEFKRIEYAQQFEVRRWLGQLCESLPCWPIDARPRSP